jgi:aryl-alcohol dehydrogenase-like predicted oxidoreductase
MNFGESTPEKESVDILIKAMENGLFFWDTADRYSEGNSEKIVGKAIKQMGNRDQVVIATKVRGKTGPGPNDQGLSRRHIVQAVDASLKRLQTDYIDLYQMHRPCSDVPLEETLETLDSLVGAGKVLYYGTSTFAGWQMADVEWTARHSGFVAPSSEQAPYNILDRRIENGRAGFFRKYGWGLITWSPLAGGQLTGRYNDASMDNLPPGSRVSRNKKYQQRMNTQSVKISHQFVQLCKEAGFAPDQAAVAWLLHQPIVTAPIIGPRNMEHLLNLIPAASLKLPADFLAKVDELVPPGTAVADFLTPNVPWQIGHLPGINQT